MYTAVNVKIFYPMLPFNMYIIVSRIMSKGNSDYNNAVKATTKNVTHRLNSERLLLIIHMKSVQVFKSKS